MKKIDADKLNRYFNKMLSVAENNPAETELGKAWYEGYITAVRTAQSYARTIAEDGRTRFFN